MSANSSFNFDQDVSRLDTGSIKWEKYDNREVLPMWVADMEFATAPEIIAAMKQRLDHPILGYTKATDSLASAVVDYLEIRHHWAIDPQWLCWFPGVVPGIAVSCAMALQDDDEVLVFTPVYHPLLIIPEKGNHRRTDVPLQYTDNRWTIDFEAFEAAITKKSKLLLLCSPHNPVGTMFTEQELRRVVEICAEHNILVVSDEIHCDLVLSKAKKHVPTGFAAKELGPHVMTLMSPSKTFNIAGANCSFAIIPDEKIRDRFNKSSLYNLPIVPTLSYTAAEAAYKHGWHWHAQLIDYLRDNHEWLKKAVNNIDGLSMDDLDATYLAWIKTADLPVDNAYEHFLQYGVGLSPGAQFGDGNFQRLNFACTRAQLQTGIDRIAHAVEALK